MISSIAAGKKWIKFNLFMIKKKIRKLEIEVSPLLLNSIFRNSTKDTLGGERPPRSLDGDIKQCCHNRTQDEE